MRSEYPDPAARYVGIDFGTTNSAIAVAGARGQASLLAFPGPAGERSDTWRTVLYFDPTSEPGVESSCAGGFAIRRYLENEGDGRLIQSIKSHLSSSLFSRTTILGKSWTLEQLIATFLSHARRAVEVDLGRRAAVGRPVRYWGAESDADDERARQRMTQALALAGFDQICFEYEPVAAASAYAARIDHSELVLVADFGGGTSDFTVVRVGPGVDPGDPRAILATGGIGIGGDDFDARFIDRVVAPMLGKGSSYQDEFGADSPIPGWLFARLRRWHHLSFLKEPRTTALLERLETGARERERIRNLRRIVERDLGLALHRSVEHAKLELSHAEAVGFRLVDPGMALSAGVERRDFETWIDPDVERLERVVVDVLARAGVSAREVDRVFATGGSSFVPAVRHRLGRIFGADRVVGGGELTSVATGLALRARERFGGG